MHAHTEAHTHPHTLTHLHVHPHTHLYTHAHSYRHSHTHTHLTRGIGRRSVEQHLSATSGSPSSSLRRAAGRPPLPQSGTPPHGAGNSVGKGGGLSSNSHNRHKNNSPRSGVSVSSINEQKAAAAAGKGQQQQQQQQQQQPSQTHSPGRFGRGKCSSDVNAQKAAEALSAFKLEEHLHAKPFVPSSR